MLQKLQTPLKVILFSLCLTSSFAADISFSGQTEVCPGQDYTYTASASNIFGPRNGAFEWTFWRNNQLIGSFGAPIVDCPAQPGTSTSTVTFNWGTVLGPVKIRIRFKGVNDPLCHFNSPDVKWVDVNVRVLSPGPISGLVFCLPNETRTLTVPGILPFNQAQSCFFHHKYDWIVPSGWSVVPANNSPYDNIEGGIRTFATSVLVTAPSTLMPGSTGNYNVIVRTEPAWPYPTQSTGMIWVASPGQPPIGTSSYNSNCSGNTFNTLNTSLSAACTANTPIYFQYRITDPNYSNFVFTPVSVPSGATWSSSGGNLYMTVNAPPSQGSRSATIALSAIGPCGPYSVNFTSTAVNFYSGYSYSFFPNPASETLTIEQTFNIEEDTEDSTFLKESSLDTHYYRLYDFNNSRVVLEGSVSRKTEIDVSKLDKGRYILKIQLANDREETHHVIIN